MFDKRLLRMVPEAKLFIAGSVLFQWIALAANVALMIAIGWFLQGLLQGAATPRQAVGLATLGLIVIVVRMMCQMVAQKMGLRASTAAKRAIRQEVYNKLLRLGPAYAESIPTNEAVQISTEGVEQLEVYFGSYLPQLFYAVLAPVTLFVCLAPLSPLVAVILLVCVPLIPLSIVAVQRIAKRVMRDYWGHYTDLGGTFLENVQGLTTLKIYQADEARHRAMNAEAETFRQATMRLLRMQLNSITVMDLLAYGGSALGVVVTLLQFADGQMSFAGAFTIVFLSAEFFIPMRSLGSLFHTAMNGMAAADKMFDLLAVPDPAGGTATVERVERMVVCGGLRYSHDGSRWALDGVDFEAPACGLVAVVGESGSGKSTLAGVLAGRNAGYEGVVRLGGSDVRELDRDELARAVTTVSFASGLFKGTVRENLLMGDGQASEERMWDALERCRLAGYVRAEGGLDAPVAEGGANLSGGQRQRLAIARALLHDSPVYVFDEATSNVDAESEQAIMAVMADLARDHAVIAISHRLAAVSGADRIYVMEDGRVIESGAHAELLAHEGAYARLWGRQQELEAFAVTADADPEGEAAVEDAASFAGAPGSSEGAAQSGSDGASAAAGRPAAASGPKPSSKAPARRRSGLSIMARLIRLVGPLVPFMLIAVVMGVAGFGSAIFLTVLGAGGLLDAAGASSFVGFGQAIALVVVCGVLRGFLHYGEQICNHFIAFKLLALIRDKVFAALRRLAPAKLEGRDKGNLVSLATSDIELLEVFYAHTISPVIIALLVSLLMTAFIATQSWQLAGIALLAYAVIGIGVPLVSSRGVQAAGRAQRDQLGDANSFVLESLRGLDEVLQYGQGSARSRALLERTMGLARAERTLKERTALFSAVTGGLVLLFDLMMILGAFSLVQDGQVGFGQAVVSVMALMSSFGPVLAVAALGTTLQQTLASGARVLDLLDEQPECPEVTDGANVTFNGAAARDVRFSYGEEAILDGVSVRFAPGQVVGISGRSGSGKSTLLKLLMRFWDPDEGAVEVSGVDLRRVNTASLRAAEGYMTQDTHLFTGTLGENILLAGPDATREQLEEACRKASLTELVEKLPCGLDTPVGELGGALSGGERQRVGLARVFLHDAPFVLLDEPTSNLDALTEASVLKALSDFRENKTIVLVSHRASTCAFADVSYSVERGRLS